MTKFEKVFGFLLLLIGVYTLAVVFGIVTPLQYWIGMLVITGLINVPIFQAIFGFIMSYGGYWFLQDDNYSQGKVK